MKLNGFIGGTQYLLYFKCTAGRDWGTIALLTLLWYCGTVPLWYYCHCCGKSLLSCYGRKLAGAE